jgi:hypothetical protein
MCLFISKDVVILMQWNFFFECIYLPRKRSSQVEETLRKVTRLRSRNRVRRTENDICSYTDNI